MSACNWAVIGFSHVRKQKRHEKRCAKCGRFVGSIYGYIPYWFGLRKKYYCYPDCELVRWKKRMHRTRKKLDNL